MEASKHVVLQWLEKAAVALGRLFATDSADAGQPLSTREQALRWLALDRTRKGFDRQAKALKREQDLIAVQLTGAIQEERNRKFLGLDGLLLQLVRKQAQVKWMEAYTAEKGIAAAEALRKAAPWHEVLVVTSSLPAEDPLEDTVPEMDA